MTQLYQTSRLLLRHSKILYLYDKFIFNHMRRLTCSNITPGCKYDTLHYGHTYYRTCSWLNSISLRVLVSHKNRRSPSPSPSPATFLCSSLNNRGNQAKVLSYAARTGKRHIVTFSEMSYGLDYLPFKTSFFS